jgi:hypothetical protein
MSEDSAAKIQLELGIQRQRELDRNHHLGGRSFYFFDFDDNIAFLATPLILFHRDTKEELAISSGDFAQFHHHIGNTGPYANFDIDYDDKAGTFRNFRDHDLQELEKATQEKTSKPQMFVQDVAEMLGFPDLQWKGPSWECFYHATFNQRPVSLITARGHHPETLKEGIRLFVKGRLLPHEPNYLSLFPVNHRPTRHLLGDGEFKESTAELKQRAIRASVDQAIQTYGYSPHHRFGMSDDDPKNIELIVEEMTRLKAKFPEMCFFMIETQNGNFMKHEVKLSGIETTVGKNGESISQLSLFEKNRR